MDPLILEGVPSAYLKAMLDASMAYEFFFTFDVSEGQVIFSYKTFDGVVSDSAAFTDDGNTLTLSKDGFS